MENKPKLKRRHLFLVIAALLMFGWVKMCESGDYARHNQEEQRELDELHNMQDKSDSLLQEVLHEIDRKQKSYSNELDSLNQIILNDNLTEEEVLKLEKKIAETEKLLQQEKNKRDTIVLTSEPLVMDSVNYNIVEKDSVVWNIIEKDSVIVKDSVVYNIIEKDSVVHNIVYQIDTVTYDSDDVKKIKLKKD